MNFFAEIKIPTFVISQCVIGIVFGFLLWRNRKVIRLNDKAVFDLIILYIIGSIVCGRLFFIIDHASDFSQTSWSIYPFYYKPGAERVWFRQMPWTMLRFWEGDMSFSAMLGGGTLLTFLILWRMKLLKSAMPYVISALCLAHILQIGSFLIGADYFGKPTDMFFGIKYANIDDVFRFPVQLFEIVAITLILFLQKRFMKLPNEKAILGIYLFLFSWIEIFASFLVDRGGTEHIASVSVGYLAVALFGIILLIFSKKSIEGNQETYNVTPSVQKMYTGIQYSGYRNYHATFSTFQKVPTSFIGRIKRRLFGTKRTEQVAP